LLFHLLYFSDNQSSAKVTLNVESGPIFRHNFRKTHNDRKEPAIFGRFKKSMMKTRFLCLFALSQLFGQPGLIFAQKRTNTEISKYNVSWKSPGNGYNSTMPLGNGDIGLNVWVEPLGDLIFYIGKTDNWDDYGRLLKSGRVRISLNPKPDLPLEAFIQTQNLKDASVKISFGNTGNKTEIEIWADANHPVIQIGIKSSIPTEALITNELWRTEQCELPSIEISDVMFDWDQKNHQRGPTLVEPDSILPDQTRCIGWLHHNRKSVGPKMCAEIQGIDDFRRIDPLLNRIFGAMVTAENPVVVDDKNLRSSLSNQHQISIYMLTLHPSTPQQWIDSIESLATDIQKIPFDIRFKSHQKWWEDFWNRSWINITSNKPGDSVSANDAFLVSRAYALQRFINACAGRGAYPIKFNGSIFTVPFAGGSGDADYRRWGSGYWWQNTRHPYTGMCSSGDFDLMKPLFNMYGNDLMPLFKYRTQKFLGHNGAFIPECIYFWGDYFSETYGWTPFEERTDKLQASRWHKYEWVSGLELTFMMLEYYDYTHDTIFLWNTAIPTANEIVTFFDKQYSADSNGKWVMQPAQSAETWWDCTNPMPEIAGLQAVIKALLNLPFDLTTTEQRNFWTELKKKIPELPVRIKDGIKMLSPAEKFENKMNVETPELYAVFPFRLITVNQGDADLALQALNHREDRGNAGWRQEDIVMAYLGLADSARHCLTQRVKNYDKNSRYPAFWGPNFDWTPDQCHGGVIMKTLQAMLMQSVGDSIFLLQAWPKDWDVDFRMHAPGRTIVDAVVRKGKISELRASPQDREKYIKIYEAQ